MFFKYETICEHFICSFWAKIGCRKLIFCDTDRFFRPSSTKVTKVFACSFYEALSSKKLSTWQALQCVTDFVALLHHCNNFA